MALNFRSAVLVIAVCTGSGAAQTATLPPVNSGPQAGRVAPRNPTRLRVVRLPADTAPPASPRVRFDWEPVPGATEYLLMGRWVTPVTWTVSEREYRVTRRTASRWTAQQVWFDASLPAGSHSWRLVAIFAPDDAGDFANPAHVSFELHEGRSEVGGWR